MEPAAAGGLCKIEHSSDEIHTEAPRPAAPHSGMRSSDVSGLTLVSFWCRVQEASAYSKQLSALVPSDERQAAGIGI